MVKIVQIGGSRYFIHNKDDERNLVRELVAQGYSLQQISEILGVKIQKIIKYLEDCWP
ncbi:terminase small subunit [Stygiolobus rod-shaped virus]|uniref:Resolvase HTH domain-containing protein n=1 Tax=Stygiolobus rod-shaped virus TaxID=537009 RepID=B6EFE3_9VIRU|nr:terminase small subunit [Stygiolobus rod-shaped virus]CAQ58478.1 hypothetical protein [Stygiolobus rod-shaped virus]